MFLDHCNFLSKLITRQCWLIRARAPPAWLLRPLHCMPLLQDEIAAGTVGRERVDSDEQLAAAVAANQKIEVNSEGTYTYKVPPAWPSLPSSHKCPNRTPYMNSLHPSRVLLRFPAAQLVWANVRCIPCECIGVCITSASKHCIIQIDRESAVLRPHLRSDHLERRLHISLFRFDCVIGTGTVYMCEPRANPTS